MFRTNQARVLSGMSLWFVMGRVMLVIASACLLAKPVFADPDQTVRISIIHSNDLHGHLYPGRDDLSLGIPKRVLGGSLATARFVESTRLKRAQDGGVILVSGGDVYHGTPEGDFTQGHAVVDFFNLLEYDAVAIGNHEFAFGVSNMLDLKKAAKFTWLGNNIVSKRPDWANQREVVTRTIKGVKIAIVGVTTPRCRELNLPAATKGLSFANCSESIVPAVKQLTDQGFLVIVLSHCGSRTEEQFATLIPDAVAVIGAHDHVLRAFPRTPDRPYIGQVGEYGRRLGIIDVQVRLGAAGPQVLSVDGKIVNLKPVAEPKTEFERKILKFSEEQRFRSFDVVVANSPIAFPRFPKGTGPSKLGALVAESMRVATGADCALVGFGGIRGGLPQGPVTLRDFYNVYPFDDNLRVLELDQKQLIKAFRNKLRGGRLAIGASGFQFRYDSTLRSSKRVYDLVVNGQKANKSGRYKLVVTEYLLQQLLVERRIKPFKVTAYDLSVFEALTSFCKVQPDNAAGAGGLLAASLVERGARTQGSVPVVPVTGAIVEAPPKFWQSLRIDVNAAGVEKLASIPWIGTDLAQKIVNYREIRGRFKSLSELADIPGITDEQFKKLERSLVVR